MPVLPPVPTVVGLGSANAGSTGSVNYAYPAGMQGGDTALLFNEVGATGGIAVPTGYANVPNSPRAQGSNVTTANLTWHRCAGTETQATVAGQANHQCGLILVVRGGIQDGNPYDTGGQGVNSNLGTALSLAGTNTTVDNCLVVLLASSAGGAADQWGAFTNAALTSITKQGFAGTALGNAGSVDVVTGIRKTAGSTGTWAATQASNQWCAIQIALLPDPAFAGWGVQL